VPEPNLDPTTFTEADLARLPWATKLKLLASFRQLPSANKSLEEQLGRDTPQQFILEVLGERPTTHALLNGYDKPWTPDQEKILDSVVVNRRTAVQSGHSVGKTAILARIALWFLYRYEGSLVITTAPTKRQVEELLWGEISSCFRKSQVRLAGRILKAQLVVGDRWQAIGFTAATGDNNDLSATGFAGFHAPRVMAIMDEAIRVDPQIVSSIEGICVGPEDRIVAISNPTDQGSWFFKATKTWESVIQLDALNHPNVLKDDALIIPGAASRVWVNDRREEWGVDSPLFLAKVRGLWPEQSEDTLIRLEWIERAKDRWQKWLSGECPDEFKGLGCAAGLDIAAGGEDLTVLSVIENGAWTIPLVDGKPTFHTGLDTTYATDLVVNTFKSGLPIRILCLDDTSLGASVTGELRRLQMAGKLPKFSIVGKDQLERPWILPINFRSVAFDDNRFADVKSELWWNLREDLRLDKLALPPDLSIQKFSLPKGNSLEGQISRPIYDQSASGGRIRVYDKRGAQGEKGREKTRLLPEKSPDLAHSLMLAAFGWKRILGKAAIKEDAKEGDVDSWWLNRVRAMMEPKKDRSSGLSPWVR
jgi:phage terminase large subunit